MNTISIGRRTFASVLSLLLLIGVLQPVSASAARTVPVIILTQYHSSLCVGEEFYLGAVTSNGVIPEFKSSNSSIASVNSYGRVTAKKAGSCRITAKVSSAETSCSVKVRKTEITVNAKNISLENGQTFQLQASASGSIVPTFSCNKTSVAVVDSNGLVTACKPGEAVITIKAGQTRVNCRIKVKKPVVKLSHLYINLFRCQQVQLSAQVSSGKTPVWKSNRTRVATVNENGLVVAQKHGTALISAKVDGVTKICEVEVMSPEIKLETESMTMSVGERKRLDYTVSSGNAPVIKSSKPHVVKVDKLGNLTAKSPGTAVITFSEDGTKETCLVRVTA